MVKGDALLVVKQFMGVCKSKNLKGKVKVIRSLLSQFDEIWQYCCDRVSASRRLDEISNDVSLPLGRVASMHP